MEIDSIQIHNFKGLRSIDLPSSRFVCVIGENNAGKSSIMQAIMRHLDGKKLNSAHFYAPGKPIEVRMRLTNIDEEDLSRVATAHREKIKERIENGGLTLLRRFHDNGDVELKIVRRLPVDTNLRREALEELLKGKRAPGLAKATHERFPELAGVVATDAKKETCLDAMLAHVDAMTEIPREEAEEVPTGIDAGLKALLPEPIYIPAVRDLGDDIKTKDGASFGRLLALVLEQLRESEEVKVIEEFFEKLAEKLNPGDQRLKQLATLEKQIDSFLKEQFSRADVSLNFETPDLKLLVSNAVIEIDDGLKADASTKGDGLRRALTFALIRTLVFVQSAHGDARNPARGRYVFLFEEPELFLHPSAQKTLFRALSALAGSHHVFVTTHSPLFFDAEKTTTFVKLTKHDGGEGERPYARSKHIDLAQLSQKLLMQAICFENNTSAFFSDTVVLLEGISDTLVVPHLAGLVHGDKGFERGSLSICRVEGKSSIKRYRDFFNSFDVKILVVADLDCTLDEFDKLGASETSKARRAEFVAALDRAVEANGEAELPNERLRDASRNGQWRDRWRTLKAAHAARRAGTASDDDVAAADEAFFTLESQARRARFLRSDAPEIVEAKRRLLEALRADGIFLLEKGAIEAYYPAAVQGHDKVSKALSFRDVVRTRDEALALCERIPDGDAVEHEFVVLFRDLFAMVDA